MCSVRLGGATRPPHQLIGKTVTVLVDNLTLRVIEPVTGEIFADHGLVAPGATSIVDEHTAAPGRTSNAAALHGPEPRSAGGSGS